LLLPLPEIPFQTLQAHNFTPKLFSLPKSFKILIFETILDDSEIIE